MKEQQSIQLSYAEVYPTVQNKNPLKDIKNFYSNFFKIVVKKMHNIKIYPLNKMFSLQYKIVNYMRIVVQQTLTYK